MPKFKARVWQQVSVWQTVDIIAEAENEEALRGGQFQVDDYLYVDTDWSTEQHLGFDTENMDVYEEFKNA